MQRENKKKILFRNEETDAVSIYESTIKGIFFKKYVTCFCVDWHDGYGSFYIKCFYPEKIEYNFTSKNEKMNHYQHCVINHLEITGFSYLKENDGYTLQFNFDNYPIGYIRLHCSEFIFECPSTPTIMGGNDHRIPWDPINMNNHLN